MTPYMASLGNNELIDITTDNSTDLFTINTLVKNDQTCASVTKTVHCGIFGWCTENGQLFEEDI